GAADRRTGTRGSRRPVDRLGHSRRPAGSTSRAAPTWRSPRSGYRRAKRVIAHTTSRDATGCRGLARGWSEGPAPVGPVGPSARRVASADDASGPRPRGGAVPRVRPAAPAGRPALLGGRTWDVSHNG